MLSFSLIAGQRSSTNTEHYIKKYPNTVNNATTNTDIGSVGIDVFGGVEVAALEVDELVGVNELDGVGVGEVMGSVDDTAALSVRG